MRIRLPFAGAFFLLLLILGYAGLSSLQLDTHVNDKFLHWVSFFLLTIVFYWILDTTRRRTLNLTLTVCTLGLGVGSEFLQSILPNGRNFDLFDIVANLVGSLMALALCTWYHQRMLERRRQRRQYNAVPGSDEADLELGEGHESGVVDGSSAGPSRTLEDEVDNWDENALDDWDNEEPDVDGAKKTSGNDDEGGDLGDARTKRSS
ncbi:hypothetical protein jhhlp_002973 [Lomentospora prolificans]|uniref:VanZ-like domain-containing protein n=1 Tax=Lomentospora prolificans TaxID=41688 RepID=A0A2N3NFR7_9PEZI|nr:hypothetical protein jhhlp_002973 [Lomentospora prolificans]